MSKRKNLLEKIRLYSLGITLGITGLSIQGLLLNDPMFQNFALGLAIFGLAAVTLLLSQVVNLED